MQAAPTVDLLSTALHYLQAASIPAIIYVVWKASRWLTKAEDRFEAAFAKLTGNDLHHIQASLDQLNGGQKDVLTEMKELREDLRELLRR